MKYFDRRSVLDVLEKFILIGKSAMINIDSIEAIYIPKDKEADEECLEIRTKTGEIFRDTQIGFGEFQARVEAALDRSEGHLRTRTASILKSVSNNVVPPVPVSQSISPSSVPGGETIVVRTAKVHVTNSSIGAYEGTLPGGPLIDKQEIVIKSPDGHILGQGVQDGLGVVKGSNVSGIVNSTGHYRLVVKNMNPPPELLVAYKVKG
ncbi:MAG: hypothetical protein ACTSVF_03360 [Candidatus Asgardarchaeia archaeon]